VTRPREGGHDVRASGPREGGDDVLAQELADRPTFSRDIAPIVFGHCSPCHRPGGSAPFSLTTLPEIRGRASLIVDVTKRRQMPPWKPTPDSGPFAGARRLEDRQIDTLARWVAGGMAEGDPRDLPALPAAGHNWQIGEPDLIVATSGSYRLPAEGSDIFRTFVLQVPVTEPRYVAGVEFRPGTRAVHHANIRFDRGTGSRELDAADPLPGYDGPVSATARYPDGYFLGWTPGQQPQLSSKGMAWRLEPGSDLVVQVHLKKTGKPEDVEFSVGFAFTAEAPSRTPFALRLGRQDIDIAPGQRYVVRDSYRLPVDVEVHSIHPHAHYRATDIRAVADLPDGTRRPLIHIDDWDFNWQDIYRFATPLALPRGTTIAMEYAYDNSAGNARNPDRAPRRVIFGQNSADEMGDLWLQVVTRTPEDRVRLVSDVMPKVLAEDATGYGMLLLADPQNQGLKIGKAATEYNLGTLLTAARRWDEAAIHLRSSIALRPGHSDAHNNLGVALRGLGRLDEAIDAFRQAVTLDPSNDAAVQNLSETLQLRIRNL
jgi:hypothetical protein